MKLCTSKEFRECNTSENNIPQDIESLIPGGYSVLYLADIDQGLPKYGLIVPIALSGGELVDSVCSVVSELSIRSELDENFACLFLLHELFLKIQEVDPNAITFPVPNGNEWINMDEALNAVARVIYCNAGRCCCRC